MVIVERTVLAEQKPLDDAILFTNSGLTALVELFLENLDVDLSKVEILKLTKIPKTLFFKQGKKNCTNNCLPKLSML